MPYTGGAGVRGLGAFTEADIEAGLRSFPNTAVRIEDGNNAGRIVDLIHIDRASGQAPVIGTLANVAAARAVFDRLEATKNDTKLEPGTEVPGSSDPKTKEQFAALNGMAVPGSSFVRPEFRGALLLPNGTISRDYSLLVVPAGREAEINAVLQAGTDLSKPSGGYVLALNAHGFVVSYVGVFPTPEMLAVITAREGNKPSTLTTMAVAVAKQEPTATRAVPVAAIPTVVYVPPVPAPDVKRTLSESETQGVNIPPAIAVPLEDESPVLLVPRSSSGGGRGGGTLPSPVPAAPAAAAAPAGVIVGQSPVVWIGAAIVAFMLLRRKGG
jgi:hypothetical protein